MLRALDQILDRVIVTGDVERLRSLDRIAFVASYADKALVTRSLVTLVTELESNGYGVVLIRASPGMLTPEWPVGFIGEPVIVTKPNVGYDFGSWATGLALFSELAEKPFVLLANDSMAGPFSSLAPMLQNFESSESDVWGATNTDEIMPHLQSYLLGFTAGILATKPLRDFWNEIRVMNDKDEIVKRYEIGLSRLLRSEGYTSQVWFDSSQVVSDGGNPTLIGWFRLLELGFPFVKRMLVANAEIFPDALDAPAAIRGMFGTELREWL